MKRFNQQGFTLVELLISMSIIGILVVLVSDYYVSRTIDQARNDTLLILQANTKQALETVARDARASTHISASNQYPDLNKPAGWTSTSGSGATVVFAVPAKDSVLNLIYADPVGHTALETNDIIYFVDPTTKTLFKRIIRNPTSGNVAISTCPQVAVTPSCPQDAKVIDDVANLSTVYYTSSGNVTLDPSLAYSVKVTLTQTRIRFGNTYQNSLSSRITLRNKP